MQKASIELPQEFHDLIEEQLDDIDHVDTVDEFVTWAAAGELVEQVHQRQSFDHPLDAAHVSEEERVLRDRIVAIARSPSR